MSPHTYHELKNKKLNPPRFKKQSGKVSINLQLGYQVFLGREAAGMTQRQLAAAIGTRQANVSRMEIGGYNFTIEMLQRIAKALNVDLRIQLTSRRSAV